MKEIKPNTTVVGKGGTKPPEYDKKITFEGGTKPPTSSTIRNSTKGGTKPPIKK